MNDSGFEKFDYDVLARDETEARKFCSRWQFDSSPAGLLAGVTEAWISRALAAEAEVAQLRDVLEQIGVLAVRTVAAQKFAQLREGGGS